MVSILVSCIMVLYSILSAARAYRKKRWICFFIFVLVLVVLAIVLGVVFGKK
jgi:t-SNARE complex subunit (syntaxin)